MNKSQNAIYGEILLLCESLEHAQFLHAYLRHMFKKGLDLPAVQIINFEGMEKLPSLVQRLPDLVGENEVRKVVFFLDGGRDVHARSSLLREMCSSSFFQGMDYVAHFFFPGASANGRLQQGYLEDYLLVALKQDSAELCDYHNLQNMCREYLHCVNGARGREHKLQNPARHFLYAYFAATEQYAGLRLGEIATRGGFDLDHEVWQELAKTLTDLQE